MHRISCSVTGGIFPDQGLTLRPLHWQADSYSLYHEGSSTDNSCFLGATSYLWGHTFLKVFFHNFQLSPFLKIFLFLCVLLPFMLEVFLECLAYWWSSEELAGSSMWTNRLLCFSTGFQLSVFAGLLWEHHLLQRNPPTAWSYMASGRSGTPIWVETSVQHPAFSDPQLCLVPEFTLDLTQLQQASTQVGERIYCHVASYSNFPPVLISAPPVHWQKWSFFWKTLPPHMGFSCLCLARLVIESESGSHSAAAAAKSLQSFHGQRSLVGCSPWGREESDTTARLHFHFSLSCIGEGNGNPLQCFCLENPRDGGAWWAAVSGVAQSHSVMFNSLWPPCNLIGSSVHGILQARILEWVAIPFSRESS